jgi:GTPase SAR1 family protein
MSLPMKGKRTFAAPKTKSYSIPKNAECPACKRTTSKVVCPSCHNNLPESTVIGKDMIISIVGSRDVGKSHFVGVIINELIERVAGKFEGSLTGFDDTMHRYEETFGRRLYVELTKLDLTQSSTTNVNNGAYKPLIFTLSVKSSSLFAKKIKNYTLVFYDTAGEDLNEFDTMSTVNRYICKSAGIIFLLDPMQIWSVRNQIDDELLSRASSVAVQQATKPDDIMTRVSRLIRNDRDMESTKKISVPVAAVFSKFDVIVPIVPQDCSVLEPSPHCNEGVFVMSDWHNVNTEIQALLRTWGATAFTQQLEINYTNFSYFAVSALGLDNSPRSDRHIDRPRPHRIEDALLWILKENGVIKSK